MRGWFCPQPNLSSWQWRMIVPNGRPPGVADALVLPRLGPEIGQLSQSLRPLEAAASAESDRSPATMGFCNPASFEEFNCGIRGRSPRRKSRIASIHHGLLAVVVIAMPNVSGYCRKSIVNFGKVRQLSRILNHLLAPNLLGPGCRSIQARRFARH